MWIYTYYSVLFFIFTMLFLLLNDCTVLYYTLLHCTLEGEVSVNTTHTDKRRFNHGSIRRKSYSRDVKIRAIALRDSGLDVEQIANILGTAKSNVEKWCSAKVCNYEYMNTYM